MKTDLSFDDTPALPIILIQQSKPQAPSKLQTTVDPSASTVAKLRSHRLYSQHSNLSWVFEQPPSVETFLSKYRAYNAKLIQDRRKMFACVRIDPDKLYIGEMNNGKCHGVGIVVFEDGRLYEGALENNLRQGDGLCVSTDGTWYYGEYSNDKRDGIGLEVTRNATFQGAFINGLKHGNGMLVGKDLLYNGEWRMGIIHGYGVLETNDSKYEGHFNNCLKHGHGRQIFKNGDQYIGNYLNGRPDGQGEYKWNQAKCTFHGNFKVGQRYGKGTWSNSQGQKYVGNYKDDVKCGYGEFYWRSGNFYKGNFLDDLRQGYGQMFWNDGSVYKGQWHRGVQHGKGELYIPGQDTFSGLFQNNMLVHQFQSPEVLRNRSLVLTQRQNSSGLPKTAADFDVSRGVAATSTVRQKIRSSYKKMPISPVGRLSKLNLHHKTKTRKHFSYSKSPQHDHSPNTHHRFCKACASKAANSQIDMRRANEKKILSRAYNVKVKDKKDVVEQFMRSHATRYLKYKF